MWNQTDFLYARPSFLEGLARVFDASGSLNTYNSMMTAEEADFWALCSDWGAVGTDLRSAVEQFGAKHCADR